MAVQGAEADVHPGLAGWGYPAGGTGTRARARAI